MQTPNADISSGLQLELQSKLIEPSKQLYSALEMNFNTLYQSIREVLFQLQTRFVDTGKQLYDNPQETITGWYDQAVFKSTELSETINNETLPELENFYQTNLTKLELFNEQWMNDVKQAAITSSDYVVAFYDNPVELSSRIYMELEKTVNHVSALSLEWFDQFKAAVISIYQATIAAANIFLDAPGATAEGLYYQSVSSLLGLYSSLINVTLEGLGYSVPALV